MSFDFDLLSAQASPEPFMCRVVLPDYLPRYIHGGCQPRLMVLKQIPIELTL